MGVWTKRVLGANLILLCLLLVSMVVMAGVDYNVILNCVQRDDPPFINLKT